MEEEVEEEEEVEQEVEKVEQEVEKERTLCRAPRISWRQRK